VRAVENVTGGNFLELYHGLASTCSKKVRLCLYEKGLSFKSHLLNLQKFEQHSPEYLALNPNGVVPTLVHHGRPIIESSVIIDYLDEAFEEPPLKPKDAYSRAQMRLWLKFSDDVAYNAVYAPTWMILSKNAMRDKTVEERRRILANIPSKERRERWEVVTRDGFSERELADAYEKMERCLDRAEKTLQTDDWLAAHDYSLADIAMVPFIDRIWKLRPEFMSEAKYPRVNDWYRRMQKRSAFSRAFDFKEDRRAAELPNI
jgi:glutathione S-transferase